MHLHYFVIWPGFNSIITQSSLKIQFTCLLLERNSMLGAQSIPLCLSWLSYLQYAGLLLHRFRYKVKMLSKITTRLKIEYTVHCMSTLWRKFTLRSVAASITVYEFLSTSEKKTGTFDGFCLYMNSSVVFKIVHWY